MNSRTFLLLLLMLPAFASAYNMQGVDNLLKGYNVSSNVISATSAMNISYSGYTYVALTNKSSGQFIFLANVSSSPYSLILNSTQIAAILRIQLINQGLKSINFTKLNKEMGQFENSSAGELNSCLTETGLNRGTTCTASNYCASCSEVPICTKVLAATGGPFGTVGEGIMSFQVEYNNLQNAYSEFSAATSTINANNVDTNVGLIVGSFSNISSGTIAMSQNPIFPPPQNADYSLCGGTGTITSNTTTTGPWYCNSVGFCDLLTYNYTMLNVVQGTVTQIQNLPITDAQIDQVAVNISDSEESYVGPALLALKTKQLSSVLNTSLSGYNASIAAANLLLTRINNQSLSNEEAALQSNYTNLRNNYITLNISTYSANVAAELTAFNGQYDQANKTYSSLVSIAHNNTAMLLEIQLSSRNPSIQSTTLSFRQIALNSELNSRINNTAALAANLTALNKQAASLLGVSGSSLLVEFVRSVDGPFVRVVLGAFNLPYSSAVGAAPLISLLLSLIIGLVLIALLFMWYRTLLKNRRLAINPRIRRNWNTVFLLAGVIFIVYLLATYSLAASANSFAPESAFQSTLHGSSALLIVLNGTESNATVNCSNQLQSAATSAGKTVQVLKMLNSTCLTSSGTGIVNNCLNSYASKDTPVIVLTQANASIVSVYSYYGTIMYVSGTSSFMNSCPVASLIR